MTRELLILRHAKSDWDAEYGGDHERPLARRGIEAAGKMGRYLTEHRKEPDLVLTSSAVRALRTARLAAKAGEWQCPIEIRPELYGASVSEWLQVVGRAPQDVQRLLVAGHEPTCSEVLEHLTGTVARIVTAACAAIRVDADDWRALGSSKCELEFLVKPKDLPG